MSLGINDVIPGETLRIAKEENVAQAYAKCDELIAKAKLGKLENRPGCDQEQTLEAMIGTVLSEVKGKVGGVCLKQPSRYNSWLLQVLKVRAVPYNSQHADQNPIDYAINVSQMVACVGQQMISGKRAPTISRAHLSFT